MADRTGCRILAAMEAQEQVLLGHRRIPPEVRRQNASRLLRDVPSPRLRVLAAVAAREARWGHVDWEHIRETHNGIQQDHGQLARPRM